MDIIDLQAVSKKYPIYERPGDRLRELLTLNRRSYHQEHWAVRDLTLGIRSGETFCVIGENGSGKSTLLQLIGGILKPTSGQVRVHGRITALLELGSGFNPEYTGRENVHLNGAILGFAAGEVERKLGQILEFAEIGDFIDQPVRTYSSGMLVRLAFAVAVHLDPDILIVDEALAVGDICFRQRCMRKIHEMRSRGVTIVYVTHDVSDVKAIGHRTLWLDRGRAAALGDSAEVVQKYLAAMIAKDARRLRSGQERVSGPAAEYFEPAEIVTSISPSARRHGDARAEVLGISVMDDRGHPIDAVRTPARLLVRVSVRAREAVRLPIVGLLVRTAEGVDVTGANTASEGVQMPPLEPGQVATVDFRIRLPELAPGRFAFAPAISDGTLRDFSLCELAEDAAEIRVLPGDAPVRGYMRIPCAGVYSAVTPPRDASTEPRP
ncbi:MAG: ABC transporter ATP-binding protein [Bryobacteraceae bacterium]|jgi:ABC-type polysaccharide/polyol phosphate transport system ATPase subunit